MIKRSLDIFIALLGLALLSPLLVLLAMVVWASMGRPILYKQLRPGLNGEPFQMLKFRTMRDATTEEALSGNDISRITPLGAFMRKFSLDELPELLHVLTGEMSLVGPRPLLMEYLPLYTPEQSRRHEVRPGITGWAQVNGRNSLSWEEKFDLDVWYVDNHSLRLDLMIMLRTISKVVAGSDTEGSDSDSTMPRFKGISDSTKELD